MNCTNALAASGAVTGASGLGWQMWSHRLTGGRVGVWPTRLKQEGRWWVRTSVSNVSRLDVTIVGYSIWRDIPGHRLKRTLWRLQAIGRLGWRKARRTQMLFNPQQLLAANGPASRAQLIDERRPTIPASCEAGIASVRRHPVQRTEDTARRVRAHG
ncbi:hypothetical protein [Streptomyces violaceusniger]|uniref:Uncharacterized protein n=1 Tax=Streptomyces violaceusniger TaxID=68280 RepID=A0A4D4LP91_STRVO|nr:hypothetical protein SVIO_108910 [Streptomyces violaceusniger]